MSAAAPPTTFDPARIERAKAEAQRAAEQALRDFELAAQPGSDPERQAARHRVVESFFALHLPEHLAPQLSEYVQTIDLRQPVAIVNAAGMSPAELSPRGKMFGLGRREQYLIGERFKPNKPEDPVYALRSCVRKP